MPQAKDAATDDGDIDFWRPAAFGRSQEVLPEVKYVNFCRWLSFQNARRVEGWNLAERIEKPEMQQELREWSLRDNELAITGWAAYWIMVGSIALVPVGWLLLEWLQARPLFSAFALAILLGPIAAIFCYVEILIRWLIGFVFPHSKLAIPGGPTVIEGNSLLVSSLVTYASIPVLYFFIDGFGQALRHGS